VRAGACTPAATVTTAKRSTVLAVEIGVWRLRFALDLPPPTAELRDLSTTVCALTGCNRADALAAVLDGLAALPAPTLADAA
jgi:hypothetical protein